MNHNWSALTMRLRYIIQQTFATTLILPDKTELVSTKATALTYKSVCPAGLAVAPMWLPTDSSRTFSAHILTLISRIGKRV